MLRAAHPNRRLAFALGPGNVYALARPRSSIYPYQMKLGRQQKIEAKRLTNGLQCTQHFQDKRLLCVLRPTDRATSTLSADTPFDMTMYDPISVVILNRKTDFTSDAHCLRRESRGAFQWGIGIRPRDGLTARDRCNPSYKTPQLLLACVLLSRLRGIA